MSKIMKIPVRKHWLWYVRNNDVVLWECISKGVDKLILLADRLTRGKA